MVGMDFVGQRAHFHAASMTVINMRKDNRASIQSNNDPCKKAVIRGLCLQRTEGKGRSTEEEFNFRSPS